MTVDQITALLRATPELLRTLLTATPVAATTWDPAPGEWSINAVIGHLIEAERRGFAGRIQHILTEAHHRCQSWEPAEVAQSRRDHAKPVQTLLAEFTQLRTASLAMVATLEPTHLTRWGEHPQVGQLTVNDLLHEWVYHDLNHLKQIESNLLALLWPDLHNAQRFYQ
jgi:hypothetical protein